MPNIGNDIIGNESRPAPSANDQRCLTLVGPVDDDKIHVLVAQDVLGRFNRCGLGNAFPRSRRTNHLKLGIAYFPRMSIEPMMSVRDDQKRWFSELFDLAHSGLVKGHGA